MGFQIALDGPAGVGKSTVANLIAKKLGFIHLDTGSMYRAITLKALRLGIKLEDEAAYDFVKDTAIDYRAGSIFLDGENVDEAIRTLEVSENVSLVSSFKSVRSHLVTVQRQLAGTHNIVMDGRDIGTTVLPEATLKIFMIASKEIRGERRFKERLTKGASVTTLADVIIELEERDYKDSHRAISPLCKADDAIIVDTENLTAQGVADKIIALAKERGLTMETTEQKVVATPQPEETTSVKKQPKKVSEKQAAGEEAVAEPVTEAKAAPAKKPAKAKTAEVKAEEAAAEPAAEAKAAPAKKKAVKAKPAEKAEAKAEEAAAEPAAEAKAAPAKKKVAKAKASEKAEEATAEPAAEAKAEEQAESTEAAGAEVEAKVADKPAEAASKAKKPAKKRVEVPFKINEIVTAKVVKVFEVDPDDREALENDRMILAVVAEDGRKFTGFIHKRNMELAPEEAEIALIDLFHEGDELSVVVRRRYDDGKILFSQKQMEEVNNFQEFVDALAEDEIFKVKVVKAGKMGYRLVTCEGDVSCFLPFKLATAHELTPGMEIEVCATRADFGRASIVVSQNKADFLRNRQALQKVFGTLEVGQIVKGPVKTITQYGAFIEIMPGVEGLLHISEISLRRIGRVESELKVGQVVEVEIIALDPETQNISLSAKALAEAELAKIKVGDILPGTVKSLESYGAFIEILPGVDGLLHISEATPGRLADINSVLAIGDKVDVEVIEFNPDENKLGFSRKALVPDAWAEFFKDKTVGDSVTGTVGKLSASGIVVRVAGEYEAFLPHSEFSWSRNEKMGDLYALGDEITAALIEVDLEKHRAILSRRQLIANPWSDLQLKAGDKVKAIVRKIGQRGINLEFSGVEGFMSVKGYPEGTEFSEGQEVEVYVLMFNAPEQRLIFTMREPRSGRKVATDGEAPRAYRRRGAKTEAAFVDKDAIEASATLGDFFRAAQNEDK